MKMVVFVVYLEALKKVASSCYAPETSISGGIDTKHPSSI
jgi:hypothetical protein